MRQRIAAALVWLVGSAGAAGAMTASICPFPDEVMPPGIALPATRAAIAQRQRLVIMTMGGGPMAGGTMADATQTYPARMQAHLARQLPGVAVVLNNRAEPDRSARSMARRLADDVTTQRPDLVVWASGGREAVRNTDIGAYANVLEAGIAAVRAAGADMILVDTQFAPGWAAIANLEAYRSVIRTVGEIEAVTVFPRFELMRFWHEAGVVNLEAADRPAQLAAAHLLFDCVGDGLARLVLRGLR